MFVRAVVKLDLQIVNMRVGADLKFINRIRLGQVDSFPFRRVQLEIVSENLLALQSSDDVMGFRFQIRLVRSLRSFLWIEALDFLRSLQEPRPHENEPENDRPAYPNIAL